MRSNPSYRRWLQAFLIGVVLAVGFYIAGGVSYRSWGAWYLPANLLLGGIPLMLTAPFLRSVAKFGWRDVRTWAWGVVWLAFLPNSFYLVTDIMHLTDAPLGLDLLYGVILYSLFAVLGMAIGFFCVYRLHRALLLALSRKTAYAVIELVFLAASFAIYFGKILRWNTWDIVVRPMGLLHDAVGTVFHPTGSGVSIIVLFFGLLSGLYASIWWVARPELKRLRD